MSHCPYHRSDFCVHAGQTVMAEPHPTPDEPAPEVTRCGCGEPASVEVNLLPRPLPLFGAAAWVAVCQSCYPETLKRGQVLGQRAIVADSPQS